ncbi:WD40 repeat-like protein [Laetiporus sulphureus 93-53]|uniref:WD40 repeat-like protein n=1 Tax=Laetiporus sulphureus 93-53 TaxID=1314785 RepID=A0A165DI08_9APHY|nr:WD40 repeat-like protein [Laetiporus sulphureus 93-53]KZT04927.1 WD40 repeat-like protein [Laetiporus sulphureus 93-53]
MRVRTLEIRWHDSKPISTCDFQPVSFKKARPAHEKHFATQAYRLATGGEDNHVRLWMVYPNILPQSIVENSSSSATVTPTPRPPRVEYLATLNRHSAPVNVVRFSPNGELIASAGDDGMIIIWSPTANPHASSYGSDLTPEELQYEKEHWKPRTTFRCTTMQVYDLAWSPTGEYIIAGSTDNCARIFTAEGNCIHELAEHNHYVQGVAWDPLDEYIATQSSDRSMHIYSISRTDDGLEVHAVGKNTRISHKHSRTPHSRTRSRPRMFRRESTASETESVITTASEQFIEESIASGSGVGNQLLTPTTSVPSTPSTTMFPPPSLEHTPSRRSSFSGSNAANSPATSHHRYGRSPSPMPALPAIRPQSVSSWASVKLYGDESYTNFFRRLTFSPDGGLLLTPAGQFEDPSVVPGSSKGGKDEQTTRGRKGHPSTTPNETNQSSTSSVYIYSRANFARPPIARLPGHKKASVAVRFSLILYELRSGVSGADQPAEPKTVLIEKGKEESVSVDIAPAALAGGSSSPMKAGPSSNVTSNIAAPSPRIAIPSGPPASTMPSPALSASDSLRPPTPLTSRGGTPAITSTPTGSVFSLPYRMLYAVATMDTITIYDTQQAGPVCLLTKLHYDEFTDMTWSADGQCLMLSSRDGYCTIVVFDEILPTYHTQQQTLQLQSIAHHHSLPLTTTSTLATPLSTPSIQPVGLPAMTSAVPGKRKVEVEAPLTPAPSVDESVLGTREADDPSALQEGPEPPKKKRRAVLTRVGDVGS